MGPGERSATEEGAEQGRAKGSRDHRGQAEQLISVWTVNRRGPVFLGVAKRQGSSRGLRLREEDSVGQRQSNT